MALLTWLFGRRARRHGMSPEGRRGQWVTLVILFVYTCVIGWAFTSGHPWIAIGTFSVFTFGLTALTVVLHLRRSRRRQQR